ncbi:hypothetical protein EPUL_000696 [Erysiphe pulchra]|uniref:Cell division control protein n=1 Tax=Erysiphe pulchra TaxID=225359 RepID=A0A2S4Q0X8_9PEZI|nr:hypothetical protein EPUL_000696 [Erysiphe pulchra]
MTSAILGKRTRSGGVTVPRKRHASLIEIDGDKDKIPFLISKPLRTEESKGLIASKTQSNTSSTPVKKTPRKRSVRSTVKVKEEPKSIATRDYLTEEEDENLLPVQTPTPQTPRKRDALSKKIPATPKHRVFITGQPITPRSSRFPLTPGGSIVTVYSLARQIFTRCSDPGPLIGREHEREILSNFIKDCLSKKSGGCIYISGPPGTGKSALVSEVVGSFDASKTVLKSCINCMSIRTLKDLYSHLLEASCVETTVYEGQEVDTLESIYVPRKHTTKYFIVTLDEIDRIVTLDSEILYKLFDWALQKKSRLILIGIANALDLTDRFLPRLKARDLRPCLLQFLPYTVEQIKAVIESRLISLMPKETTTRNYIPFLHPAAIELCSRKVSSQNGDLRKAFEICRRAINIIESEVKLNHERALNEHIFLESPSKRPLQDNLNLSKAYHNDMKKNLAESLAALTVETAPRASISHINKITSSIFGNGTNQRLKALNLQQKATLCALVTLEKRKRRDLADNLSTPSKSKDAAPNIKILYEVYCRLCKRDRVLHPLSNIEFKDLIGSLESLSLVSVVGGSFIEPNGKIGRACKFRAGSRAYDEKGINSCVGEAEIAQVIEGLGSDILKTILTGEGLD